MPTPNNYNGFDFSYEEIAKNLMRSMGISQGLWSLQLRFNLIPTNFSDDGSEATTAPAIINKIVGLSLNPVTASGFMVYDAALLNPLGLNHGATAVLMPPVPLPPAP